MDEELNAMVYPHPWFPLSHMRNEEQLEINPVRIDALIYAWIGFDPIAVNISGIGFLRAKASVNVDLFNPSRPKRRGRGPKAPQQPPAPRREPKPLLYLFHRCAVIARRQRTGLGIERGYQTNSIISETIDIVNIIAVNHIRCLTMASPDIAMA
jgi:hypothetical protein